MSAIIGGISQNSDLQSMIFQMFNKINNATINSGEKTSALDTTKAINVEDFARNLEKQLQVEKEIQKQGKTKLIKIATPICNFLLKFGIDIRRNVFKDIINNLGGSLRAIISGASALDPKVARAFNNFGILIFHGYGYYTTLSILWIIGGRTILDFVIKVSGFI